MCVAALYFSYHILLVTAWRLNREWRSSTVQARPVYGTRREEVENDRPIQEWAMTGFFIEPLHSVCPAMAREANTLRRVADRRKGYKPSRKTSVLYCLGFYHRLVSPQCIIFPLMLLSIFEAFSSACPSILKSLAGRSRLYNMRGIGRRMKNWTSCQRSRVLAVLSHPQIPGEMNSAILSGTPINSPHTATYQAASVGFYTAYLPSTSV